MSHQIYNVILDILEQVGCKQIFGVFGDAINPLADALRRDEGKRFEWIGTRHEEVAAFAASAQGKLTGNIGVCAGTVGPGAIHLLNGLYDAKMDYAPVLALTGQIPRDELGTDYHQEVNLDRLFDDVCVYNQSVYTSGQMPRLVLLAIQKAIARKGVAHISIPTDLGHDEAGSMALEHKVFRHEETGICPAKHKVEEAATMINEAENITLFVGWGAREAGPEVLKTAEKLKAPVVHALKGKAVLPQNNPYWVGGTGMLGSKGGIHALEKADVILLLGTDFPYRQFYPKDKTVIQIDSRPENLGRRYGISLGLVGHTKTALNDLLPLLKEKTSTSHLESAQKARDKWQETLIHKTSLENAKPPIRPQALAHCINKYANDSAIFTADTGETILWMARFIEMKGQRDFIASFNHATMANAMPQAIGAQALDRSRQVVAMCGDGGFSMLMSDFITAVTYNLPIKVFVFNNGALGLVKMEMLSTGMRPWGIDLKNPNFADCAKAMGGEGIRVEQPEALENAVKRAFECDGPVVVDVLTNGNELTVPPKIPPAKAWGFFMSKMRQIFE